MVGHYWLRAPDLAPTPGISADIRKAIADVKSFASGVHAGTIRPPAAPRFTRVLSIGIGGSALGPMLVALFDQAPELYDGMDLAEYIERVGLLRSDGRTLIGQPHLHTDERHLWTIDDIRRLGVEIRDPLRDVAAADLPVIG